MSDEIPTQTDAAQGLWIAVREFLKATAADDGTTVELIERMAASQELAVMVAITPEPRIGIAGCDGRGRFAQSYALRSTRARELN
jgi:hypothetical protein